MNTYQIAVGQTTATTSDTYSVDFHNATKGLTAVAVFNIAATAHTLDLQGSPDGGTTWASIVKKSEAEMTSNTAAFTIALMPHLRVVSTEASSATEANLWVVHE